MTPEEYADTIIARLTMEPQGRWDADVVEFETKSADIGEVKAWIAEGIRRAVAEERAACVAAMCPRCATGEPVLDVEDCRMLGHPPGPCHRYQAPVVTHIRCLAAAILARGA